ncbi:MAG TPA: hypothetical protein DIV44_06540 [Leeuwenhoekiella sp.]|nr:hypothetical protein [Leeuwenhoekiella sp.]HBO30677.1 hypothetical protein [Leeuwenhoekiella sp.]HCQ76451.1 hypothetical protein [Leeuwenhoekiella sp.]
MTFADNLPIPFYIPGIISSMQAMDHFMQSKMEAVSLKFCSPRANEKEKQEGNPLREVTRQSYLHQPQ